MLLFSFEVILTFLYFLSNSYAPYDIKGQN
jgi:hypothetical protein